MSEPRTVYDDQNPRGRQEAPVGWQESLLTDGERHLELLRRLNTIDAQLLRIENLLVTVLGHVEPVSDEQYQKMVQESEEVWKKISKSLKNKEVPR